MACAVVPWFVAEPLLLRLTTALAAAVGVAAAVTLRRWDASAGLNVAELKRARASAEWQHEERVAELEADLEEGRELRIKLEQRLRSKRAELAALRNEHASLLRRYATAETERASALEGRRLLELEAADPVPELPPARETRALGPAPAPAPEPASPFSPAGSGLFRQAVEALDSLEALQAAAGAEEAGLAPGDEAGVEGFVDVDVDEDGDADAVGDAGSVTGSAADGVADAEEDVEGTERAGEAPGGYDAGAGASAAVSHPAGAGWETAGVAGTGRTADASPTEVSPAGSGAGDADGSEDVVRARGAVGAQDAPAPEGSLRPHGAASAAQAEVTPDQADPRGGADPHGSADPRGEAAPDAGTSAVAGADDAEGPEAGGAEGGSGGPAASGGTTAKPVRPSGGHFTVPTAVAVVPGAPAPRRPAAEGSFDFFGTQRTDHGADGDTDRTGRTVGDDRQQSTPASQPSPAPRGPQVPRSSQPAPAPQPPRSVPSAQPSQASSAAAGPEPQPQPLIRSQQTGHRADVGRVIDVDGQDDDLHAAS